MIEIIPAIIEDHWDGVREKLEKLEGLTEWVHIDVSDGNFTTHKTWDNPKNLLEIETEINIETHLMIERPWETIGAWIKAGTRRVIVHWEAISGKGRLEQIYEEVKGQGLQIVVALNLDTKPEVIKPYLDSINGVLVMAITPGWSGSTFHQGVIGKIKTLRSWWSDGIIGVDGGVNDTRAPGLVSAGANRLISSSFLWSFDSIEEGIRVLKKSTQKT